MVFKQNFTLHFFYGDSVNAIQIQTWVVLIANLLITVLPRRHQEALCFLSCCYHGTNSCLCTTLILSHSWKILTKHGTIFWPRRNKKHHQSHVFSIRDAYFWKTNPKVQFYWVSGRIFMLFWFLPDSNIWSDQFLYCTPNGMACWYSCIGRFT